MKHPLRRIIAVGSAAAIAAMVIVPLASTSAVAASAKPAVRHTFNNAVAVKFLKSMDKMRLAHGTLGKSELKIKGQTGFGSYNWSGYAEAATPSDTFPDTYSKVSATWKEPDIVCDASDSYYQIAAFWVGLDGFDSGTVEQDGTIEECYQGEYLGAADWWEMYPYNAVDIIDGISTGQSIHSSVSYNASNGKYTLAVKVAHDPGESFSVKESCVVLEGSPCANSSAEWIGEAPCCNGSYEYDLAEWAPYIKFTAAKVTGSAGTGTISSYDGGGVEDFLEMFGDQSGNPIADVTATNGPGTSFKDYWFGLN
ncbi:MAG: G1 family glutamic endopeptidase [Acidimicrobiales bacterium]|jgi:hypothetical protein